MRVLAICWRGLTDRFLPVYLASAIPNRAAFAHQALPRCLRDSARDPTQFLAILSQYDSSAPFASFRILLDTHRDQTQPVASGLPRFTAHFGARLTVILTCPLSCCVRAPHAGLPVCCCCALSRVRSSRSLEARQRAHPPRWGDMPRPCTLPCRHCRRTSHERCSCPWVLSGEFDRGR
jgi:hypothetical protein